MILTCLVAVCSIFFIRISIRLIGTWFTPLSHYGLRWFLLVFLVQLNLIGYDEISFLTWAVVIGSFLTFSLGALIPLIGRRIKQLSNHCTHIQQDLKSSVDRGKFLQAIVLLFIMGAFVFAIYIYNVHRAYGIVGFLSQGQILRISISEGNVPFGFHYLYIMELVGPLCFLFFLIYRRMTPWWVFGMMIFSIISLFFTTGRTNMMKAVVWIFYVYVFFEIENLNLRRFARKIGTLLVIAMGIFYLIGLWTSKTYESTEYFPTSEFSGPAASLLVPYFYMSVELPTLDKLLKDPTVEYELGKYTILPVIKLEALLFPDIKAPSHIGEFYNSPYSANIATYLDLMYKDFGLIGPLLIPALIGFICSVFFVKLMREKVTLATFMINTVLAMTIFSSASAANYMKPSYWFQIAVVIILSKLCGGKLG